MHQIEWSPLLFDPATVAAHPERDVALERYSDLRGGTLEHPTIEATARRVGRTPAQVIVRWHLQHQVVVTPKSAHPDRNRSSADVAGLELPADDMAAIDARRRRRDGVEAAGGASTAV